MNVKEIVDRKGRTFQWDDSDEYGWFVELSTNFVKDGMAAEMKKVKNLDLRADDVMLCAFPKTGTNLVWEITSMVLKGRAEYHKYLKMAAMVELRSEKFLESLSSPRVLNTHVYASCLPEDLLKKRIKTIHVMRHPKDIVVSLFYHMKQNNFLFKEPPFETFSEFLPYVTGEYGVYLIVSLFRYLNEFETFAKKHSDLVLNLYFEEIIKDPVTAVQTIANFLGKTLTPEVVQDIADKCSFSNMKAAEYTVKEYPEELTAFMGQKEKEELAKPGSFTFFRKGEAGDWRNHFTAAESAAFDKLLEERLKDNKYLKYFS